jgi:hypothetical protein
MQFVKGERVKTALGQGRVLSQRMKPPLYIEAEAVSVCLDSKKEWLGINYGGTMFPADEVIKISD